MENKVIKIDDVSFDLRREEDFSWLKKYGKVFCVFAEQDSGNICFGVANEDERVFVKYAGAYTKEYEGKPEDAVKRMKSSLSVYENISHPNLIKLIEHYGQGNGYVCVYKWVDGECLHAHWNFEKFPKYTHPESPNYKFNNLDLKYKLNCLDGIFSLHKEVARCGYVAIDFYDGSIMYDFYNHKTTICDIDFYSKSPYVNNMGRMLGSSRFMSPEEFELGAIIDEVTNVFTMGAVAFELLGNNTTRSLEEWQASKSLYEVAQKAISTLREERYQSIEEFYFAWEKALADKNR